MHKKVGTIAARTHKLAASRQELEALRAQGAPIFHCARLSRDIDRQEAELADALAKERAMTPEQRKDRELARLARIDKYMRSLRKNKEGGDA